MTAAPRSQYDLIFAGGGTVACVTAGRLAAADPNLRILIIEAGAHTKGTSTHVQPNSFFKNLMTGGPSLFQHVGRYSEELGGRAPVTQSGKCVGGGASVNFMMYTRASASDYDDWEKLGNPGWGAKDLIPLANKAETYEPWWAPNGNAAHGTSGPIKISSGGVRTNIASDFLDTAAVYDPGRSHKDDTHDFETIDAYSRWPMYIDRKTGTRSDAAHHYLYYPAPINVDILSDHRVVKIIIRDGIAVGVEYVHHNRREEQLQAIANKLVVLSAGTFGSVAILERSGIGERKHLEKLGIPVVVDLPGVGENYNDHNTTAVCYLAPTDSLTVDLAFRGEDVDLAEHLAQWRATGDGLLASNGLESGIKMRPNQKDLVNIGPGFKNTWDSFYVPAPDKAVMWIGPMAFTLGPYQAPAGNTVFTMTYWTMYPLSTGSVHIQHASDAFAQLDWDPRYLSKLEDLLVLRWAYKRSREYARRMASYRGELAPSHPQFPDGSAAAVSSATGPVASDAPDILYTKEDDLAIDAFNRRTLISTWHSLGTCAMTPRSHNGVVDPFLNVYGVKCLKIADLSIAPKNVGANTYNTALIIGEKAALIIAKELGIERNV